MDRMLWWLFAQAALLLTTGAAAPGAPESLRGETPCATDVSIPGKAIWLPEGNKFGDEMQPGNYIAVSCVWTGGHPGEKKKIKVTLAPSRKRGQCINSGDQMHEDFTLENSLNSEKWDLTGPDLVYPSFQTTEAETREPVEADTPVTIFVTSYDWRGVFSISGEADGCHPDSDGAPLDTDGDSLPDAFEGQAKYWNRDTGERLTYNPNLARSPGISGANDGVDDSDVDLPYGGGPPVHEVLGDGLTAYEEYGALLVQGVVHRTISAQDDRTGQTGGTDKKDLYLFDPTQGASTTEMFQPATNPFLSDFGLIWHRIKANEMTNDGTLKAGVINKNENANQRAVKLERKDGLTRKGIELLGDAQSFSIRDGLTVQINVRRIQDVADDYNLSSRLLLDFVVAHEIGHKLSLPHNEGNRKFKAVAPDPPNRADWFAGNTAKALEYWVPIFKGKSGGAQELEFPDPDALSIVVRKQGTKAQPKDMQVEAHGVGHDARIYLIQSKDPVPQATEVKIQAHEKNLMDPVPAPDEVGGIQADPLTPAQAKKVDVKS
jgi:hypothetical protein